MFIIIQKNISKKPKNSLIKSLFQIKEGNSMDMKIELYVEVNGIKYQIDPECCSLCFTASTNKGNKINGCLEVKTDSKTVCLDIV